MTRDRAIRRGPTGGRRAWIALPVVLALALTLRMVNLGFGLPHVYHIDEVNKVNVVSYMLEQSTADPDYFKHPAFTLYAVTGLCAARQWLVGENPADLPRPDRLYTGRLAVAVMGFMTVIVVFLCGRRLAGAWAGVAASLILAVTPLHVVCSHYIKEDVPLAMWVSVVLLFCLRLIDDQKTSSLLLASVATGMAASTKYPGAMMLLPVFLAAGLAWVHGKRGSRDSGVGRYVAPAPPHADGESGHPEPAGRIEVTDRRPVARSVAWRLLLVFVLVPLLASVIFCAVNPYMLINRGQAQKHLTHEFNHADQGHDKHFREDPQTDHWLYHLRHSLVKGMTRPLLSLCLVGMVFSLFRYGRKAVLLTFAFLLVYFAHEQSPLKPPPQPERYMVMALPMLCILGGGFIAGIGSLWRRRSGPVAWGLGAMLILSVVPAVPALVKSSCLVAAMVPDTRTQAATWISENCPTGSLFLIDGHENYGPFMPDGYECLVLHDIFSIRRDNGKGHSGLDLGTQQIDKYRDQLPPFRPHYLVLSSMYYQRFLDYPEACPDATEFYTRDIPAKLGDPVVIFTAREGPYGFNNPVIKIFRLEQNPLPGH